MASDRGRSRLEEPQMRSKIDGGSRAAGGMTRLHKMWLPRAELSEKRKRGGSEKGKNPGTPTLSILRLLGKAIGWRNPVPGDGLEIREKRREVTR